MSILMAGLSLCFSSVYISLPPFERLENAGYTREVPSLLEALLDEDRSICKDAAAHLKGRVEDSDCSDILAAVRAAVDRDCLGCVFSISKLLISDCGIKEPPDEVLAYARALSYSDSNSLAYRVLYLFHLELGLDIFEDALHCALNLRYITDRYNMFKVLLKSYCHRLQARDFEAIHRSLMEGDQRRENMEPWREELLDQTEARVRERVETLLQQHPFPCPEEQD